MDFRCLVLSLLLVGVLPARCQDAARAYMQQDDGSPLDLERQLSVFLENLAHTIHSQEDRLLALEQKLQTITQQGAAHMQELGLVRETVEAGLRWKLNFPEEDVRSVIAEKAVRVKRDRKAEARFWMAVALVIWFAFKVFLVIFSAGSVLQLADRCFKSVGYSRVPVYVRRASLLCTLGLVVYLIYRWILNLVALEFRLLI